MEYAKGKISARGREITWLNHPCYLGYRVRWDINYYYLSYVFCIFLTLYTFGDQ